MNEITMTDLFVARMARIVKDEEKDIFGVRAGLVGGGCSGMQYNFALVETPDDDDTVFTQDGFNLVIDPVSMMYLDGAEFDFKTSLEGENIVVKNPNQTGRSCGCGKSFSV